MSESVLYSDNSFLKIAQSIKEVCLNISALLYLVMKSWIFCFLFNQKLMNIFFDYFEILTQLFLNILSHLALGIFNGIPFSFKPLHLFLA
jgi:hypothetical protein